jgi:hypothetical protein
LLYLGIHTDAECCLSHDMHPLSVYMFDLYLIVT